jgi:hypothetical protein
MDVFSACLAPCAGRAVLESAPTRRFAASAACLSCGVVRAPGPVPVREVPPVPLQRLQPVSLGSTDSIGAPKIVSICRHKNAADDS